MIQVLFFKCLVFICQEQEDLVLETEKKMETNIKSKEEIKKWKLRMLQDALAYVSIVVGHQNFGRIPKLMEMMIESHPKVPEALPGTIITIDNVNIVPPSVSYFRSIAKVGSVAKNCPQWPTMAKNWTSSMQNDEILLKIEGYSKRKEDVFTKDSLFTSELIVLEALYDFRLFLCMETSIHAKDSLDKESEAFWISGSLLNQDCGIVKEFYSDGYYPTDGSKLLYRDASNDLSLLDCTGKPHEEFRVFKNVCIHKSYKNLWNSKQEVLSHLEFLESIRVGDSVSLFSDVCYLKRANMPSQYVRAESSNKKPTSSTGTWKVISITPSKKNQNLLPEDIFVDSTPNMVLLKGFSGKSIDTMLLMGLEWIRTREKNKSNPLPLWISTNAFTILPDMYLVLMIKEWPIVKLLCMEDSRRFNVVFESGKEYSFVLDHPPFRAFQTEKAAKNFQQWQKEYVRKTVPNLELGDLVLPKYAIAGWEPFKRERFGIHQTHYVILNTRICKSKKRTLENMMDLFEEEEIPLVSKSKKTKKQTRSKKSQDEVILLPDDFETEPKKLQIPVSKATYEKTFQIQINGKLLTLTENDIVDCLIISQDLDFFEFKNFHNPFPTPVRIERDQTYQISTVSRKNTPFDIVPKRLTSFGITTEDQKFIDYSEIHSIGKKATKVVLDESD